MVTCPTCNGTGHERDYEPWDDCPECDGCGSVPNDHDDAETEDEAELDYEGML